MGTENMQWMCDPCKKKFTPAATRIKIDMNGVYKRSRRKCMRVNINVTCFTHDNNFTHYIRFGGNLMQTKYFKGVLSKTYWFLNYSLCFSNVSHQYLKTIMTPMKNSMHFCLSYSHH